MADSRVFKLGDEVTAKGIAREIEVFLRERKGLFVENIEAPEGFLVQAKQESKLKTMTGMGMATQIQIIPAGEQVTVNIGEGKWADKAGAAAAGWFLFAPLAVTAGIGVWNQRKLPAEIFELVEKYIISGGKSVTVGVSASNKLSDDQIICPKCKTVNDKSKRFCGECGEKLTATCPHCNADVAPGTKFCPDCGKSMESSRSCASCGADMADHEKFCSQCGAKAG